MKKENNYYTKELASWREFRVRKGGYFGQLTKKALEKGARKVGQKFFGFSFSFFLCVESAALSGFSLRFFLLLILDNQRNAYEVHANVTISAFS